MEFEWADENMMLCQKYFNELEPDQRLFMTHYELAKNTPIQDSSLWKQFLIDPKVNEWINAEMTLFTQAQQRKLFQKATADSRSPGAAQMINALGKSLEGSTIKEGPVFIYSYIPLNEKEVQAPNTNILDHDIFQRGE